MPEGVLVFGEALRVAMPDYVELYSAIQADGATASQALQENAKRIEHVRRVALTVGVGSSDFQAAVFALNPSYPGMSGSGTPPQSGATPVPSSQFPYSSQPASVGNAPSFGGSGPIATSVSELPPPFGYRVSSIVKLSIPDLNRVGEVLETLARAGVMLNGGMAFRLRDKSPVRQAVLEDALRQARHKAEALAASAGRELGNSLSITEQAFTDTGMIPPSLRDSMIGARVSVWYAFR